MLLDLDFMSMDQIAKISFNGLRRRVATHDKTETESRMDEPSVTLYLEYQISFSGAPPMSFLFLEKCLLEDLQD
jgi:hypothetical protein